LNQSPKYQICHISTAHAVRDIRIFYKECISLSKHGYDVNFVVSHDRDESIEGIRIVHLPQTKSRFRRIFIHTWIAFLKALKTNSQVYHFHDPELLPIGCILRLFGKKVIYDVHEHVSKDILDKPWIQFLFVRKIISRLTGYIEQISVRLLSGVVAATEHIGAQFDNKKTVIIRNFPILGFISQIPSDPKRTDGKKVIVYTGGLTRIRGLVQMVDAMEKLPADSILVLAGQWEDNSLEQECKNRAGWSKCQWIGHVPQREAYALMKSADVGLVTYLPAANHFEAMPNKAFEYMACDIPMVISDFPYWRELFGKTAVFADPLDPESIASGIIEALSRPQLNRSQADPTEPQTLQLSWESEEKVLLDFYKRILQDS
jgi:glycosyltransferase involved in cell wall biosynthesis